MTSVLIIDDSLTVRMDLAEALAEAGFDTIPCATAAEARLGLATSTVDAVILDVVLPDGDGVELLEQIRASEAGASAPVLMLSTEAEVADRVRALRTGADEYVGKPYDTGYVVARIRELVRSRARREARPALAGDRAEPARPSVLVIDDSATSREQLALACRAAGYDVVTAGDGDEGLRLAAASRPDAVIVDGVLPGIDGPTVVRRIRLDAALRSTPCLLLTGADERDAELRALDAGADAFVRKQEDVEILLARLDAVLRRSSSAPVEHAASLAGPKRILAVDDSPTYLRGLAGELRREGFDVILARSGEEALELVAVQAVDCILLDLVMPGLGGEETCRRIKSAPGLDVPLVMLTAREDRDAMIGALAAGADDVVPKSSELEVLLARVRAQLRRRQFEDENRRSRDELLRSEIEATEARAARELAETRAALVNELEDRNRELEAFSYSVSHDLKAPLRRIEGFSRALAEDQADRLDERGRDDLRRLRASVTRMGELIDDLLALSRVGRTELVRQQVDITALARSVADELVARDPDRQVTIRVADGLTAEADIRLMTVVLENLLSNAWKFTARNDPSHIEVAPLPDGGPGFVVADDGAGFDQRRAERLFEPFQRLHAESDYPGTGIGLATVRRIVERHHGQVHATAVVGGGSEFSVTVPPTPSWSPT